LISEEIREYIEHLTDAKQVTKGNLIDVYSMLLQRELQLVEETNHIMVTKSMLEEQLLEVGVDVSNLGG